MPDYDTVPEKVITALREADKGRVFVPPGHDEAILARAKANLTRRQKFRMVPWLAAAAALVIATLVILTPPTPKVREDVNRDGRVDIRDALVLARKISDGQVRGSVWDFNHDGRVDQGDVAAVAALAVKL